MTNTDDIGKALRHLIALMKELESVETSTFDKRTAAQLVNWSHTWLRSHGYNVIAALQAPIVTDWQPIDLDLVPKGKPVLVAGKYSQEHQFFMYCVAEYYPKNSLEIRESYAGQLDSDDAVYADAGWYREATNDDEDCIELGFAPLYFQLIEPPIVTAGVNNEP